MFSKSRAFVIALLFGAVVSCAQTNPMAKNYDVTRKAVVFIYAKDVQGKETPEGTGFLISVPLKSDASAGYLFLVTARRIADPGWLGCPALHLVAKLNKNDFDPQKDSLGTAEYDLGNQQWIAPEDQSVDLAYTLLNGKQFEDLNVENVGLKLGNLPSAADVKALSVGDPVLSAGLLVTDALSAKRNYPIFKFGNISSIPQEKISINGCNGTAKLLTEWLVAANLVPGNSGSPVVFVPRTDSVLQRWFILGVQSTSFIGSDVAGVAPIRFLVESIRQLLLPNADFSKPADPLDVPAVEAAPTGMPSQIPSVPVPLKIPQ